MTIRPYKPEDFEQIKAIHAQRGHDFELLDLSRPEFVSVWVAEVDGKIVSAVAGRKMVEISAFVAQDWGNPSWRLEVLKELQQRGSEDLASQGFTELTCWVKSEIHGFGRRLVRSMGWIKSVSGECFVKEV